MSPRLAWIEELVATLNRATGGQIKKCEVVGTVDPLKVGVLLFMEEKLEGENFHPLSRLARGFAEANDCVLDRIRRVGPNLILDILLKRRLGPVMNKNPLGEKKV